MNISETTESAVVAQPDKVQAKVISLPKKADKVPVKKAAPKKEAEKAPAKKEAPKVIVKATRSGNQNITLLEKANPHRKGSKDFAKWAKLAGLSARTVANAVAAKVDRGYLRYASNKGLIKLEKA